MPDFQITPVTEFFYFKYRNHLPITSLTPPTLSNAIETAITILREASQESRWYYARNLFDPTCIFLLGRWKNERERAEHRAEINEVIGILEDEAKGEHDGRNLITNWVMKEDFFGGQDLKYGPLSEMLPIIRFERFFVKVEDKPRWVCRFRRRCLELSGTGWPPKPYQTMGSYRLDEPFELGEQRTKLKEWATFMTFRDMKTHHCFKKTFRYYSYRNAAEKFGHGRQVFLLWNTENRIPEPFRGQVPTQKDQELETKWSVFEDLRAHEENSVMSTQTWMKSMSAGFRKVGYAMKEAYISNSTPNSYWTNQY